MFNVGGPEILVILLLALVVLGPDQLPKAMRTFGNVMAEIRKVSGGFQDEMRKAIESIDDTGSGSSSSSGPSPTSPATTPEEADVTEVVARNPALPGGANADAAAAAPDGSSDGTDADGPPAIGPADRASG